MPSKNRTRRPIEGPRRSSIVRDGQVIAERYADGVGIDTPLPSFSMTKSMVNALLGILTRQGVLTPSFPAPVPEWRAASDPRHEIEIEHMMRMTTGLALDETNSGYDPSNQMYLLRRHGRFCGEGAADCAAGNALGLFQRHHAATGADHPRRASAGPSRRWHWRGANCSIRWGCAT